MYVCLSGKGLEQERSIRYTCQALEQRRIKKIEFFFPALLRVIPVFGSSKRRGMNV